MTIHSEHLSEVDCTREDVRVQARWELNRAETEGPEDMAMWADKWGRALLTAADARDNSEALAEAESDANEAEKSLKDLTDAASTAVDKLKKLSERGDVSERHSNILADIFEALDEALPA